MSEHEHQTEFKSPLFRFSREVSLGHLLLAATTAFSVMGAYFQLKAENQIQDVRIGVVEQRFERDSSETRTILYRIETKLDQKQDKR